MRTHPKNKLHFSCCYHGLSVTGFVITAWVGIRWKSEQPDEETNTINTLHPDTTHSVGFLWDSDQHDAQTHTTITLHPGTTHSVGVPWNSDQPDAQIHKIITLHPGTTHSVEVTWNSDQPDTQTHTIITTDKHRCLRRDSNRHYQQRAAAELHISASPVIILSEFCCFPVLSA